MLSAETGHGAVCPSAPNDAAPGYPLGSTVLCETKCTALSLRGPTQRTVN